MDRFHCRITLWGSLLVSSLGTQKELFWVTFGGEIHQKTCENREKGRGIRALRSRPDKEGLDGWWDRVPTKNGISSLPERVRLLVRLLKRCCFPRSVG